MGLAKMYELIGPAGVALILVAAAGLYLTIWTVIYLIRTGRGFRSTIHEAEADGGRHFRERTEGNLNPLVCVVREVVLRMDPIQTISGLRSRTSFISTSLP